MDDDDDRLEDPADAVSPYPSYYEGPRLDLDFQGVSKSGSGSGDLRNTYRDRHDIDCTLWVGNLDERVSEAIIQELFLQIGPIQSVIFPKRKDDPGRNRGYCFVNFFHPNSVPRAMKAIGETVLFGRKLNLQSRPHSVHSGRQNLMLGSDRFVEVVENPSGNPASSGLKRPFGTNSEHHIPPVPFHRMDDHHSQYSRSVCIAKDPDISEESSATRKVVVVHSSLCSEPDVQIKISNYSAPKISSVLVTPPPPSSATGSEMNTKESNTSSREDTGHSTESSKFDSSDVKRSHLSDCPWKSSEYSGRSRDTILEPTKTHRNVSFPKPNDSISNEPVVPPMRMNESNEHMRFNQPYGTHWQDYWQSGGTEDPLVSNQWGYENQVHRPHGRYIWLNANFHQQQQHHHHQNHQNFHPYYSHQRFYNNNEPFRQGYGNQSETYSTRTNNSQFSWDNSYWKASNYHPQSGPYRQRQFSYQNPSENFEAYHQNQAFQSNRDHRELINLSPPKQAKPEIPESTTTSSNSSSRPQNDQTGPTNSLGSKSHNSSSSRHRSSSSDSAASRKHKRHRRRRRYSSSSSSSYSSIRSSNDDKQVSSSSHIRSKFSSSGRKKSCSKLLSPSPDRPSEYDPHHPQL